MMKYSLFTDMEENPICIQYPYILFVMIGEIFESHFKIIDGLMFALFSVTLGQVKSFVVYLLLYLFTIIYSLDKKIKI